MHQFLLGALPCGEVLHLEEQEVRLGAGAHARAAQHHPDVATVGGDPPLLEPVAVDLAPQHLVDVGQLGLEVGRIRDDGGGDPEQLLGRVAQKGAERPVHLDEAAVPSDQRHADRSVVEGGSQARDGGGGAGTLTAVGTVGPLAACGSWPFRLSHAALHSV